MTTRQTAAPLPDYRLNTTSRSVMDIVRSMLDEIDLNPPYQRGSVWTDDQRIALVKSWVMGVPVPAVLFNLRDNPEWSKNESDVSKTGAPYWAVVDGKQRIETAAAWFTNRLGVPASWFDPADVFDPYETDDGPYVKYEGLTESRKRFLSRAQLAITEGRLPSLRVEAELYLLVNGGGTAQTEADMANAAVYAAAS
jgi:hypothetical protein